MNGKQDEYRALRGQIEGQFKLIIQIFVVSIVASVALFGYVFQAIAQSAITSSWMTPFFFLTPMAIIIPCAYLLASLRREIFQWAAYLQVFHESEQGPRYETILNMYRDKYKPQESLTPIVWTYWALFIVCCSAYGWELSEISSSLWYLCILLIPFVMLFTWHRGYTRIPKRYREETWRRWTEIKKIMGEENSE